MKQKRARTVDLISVHDYPADRYTAYWTIGVDGDDSLGYRWWAEIHTNKPHSWKHNGEVTAERPEAPDPNDFYPPDIPVLPKSASPEDQAAAALANEVRRKRVMEIHAAHPQPVHLIESETGTTDTRDEADRAAQTWVLKSMPKYKRKKPLDKQAGYATIGLLLSPLDVIAELIRWLLRPLFALAYSTTVRNNRLTQVLNAIDAGAGVGLWRIYDGTRPASCGTATTKLAELAMSKPSFAVAASVATAAAITAANAIATSTATWFRIVDSTGTCCVDGNVGTSGSDLNLNSTSIATGQQVSITSAVITEGNP